MRCTDSRTLCVPVTGIISIFDAERQSQYSHAGAWERESKRTRKTNIFLAYTPSAHCSRTHAPRGRAMWTLCVKQRCE